MSLISDRKDKSSGAYERILGNKKIDALISKIHATTISAGRELEKLIYKNSNLPMINQINELEKILTTKDNEIKSFFILNKFLFKKIQDGGKNRPDFIIVDTIKNQIKVIELKEGVVFDTKKSEGEYKHLKEFKDLIENYLKKLTPEQEPFFKVETYFCSFHAETREEITAGTKKKIPIDFLLTKNDLCQFLSVDFGLISSTRAQQQKENFKFFVSSLAEIPEVVDGMVEVISMKMKNPRN